MPLTLNLNSQQAKDDVTVASLAADWTRRHAVVDKKDQEDLEVPEHVVTVTECAKVGFCICQGRGEQVHWFWNNARTILKDRFSGDAMKRLRSGQVWLFWRGYREADEPLAVYCAHCPLHYLKPWRPTFWQVDLDEASAVKALQQNLGGEFLTLVLKTNEPAAFHTPYTLINSFNLDLRYEMCFAELSTRAVPWPNSTGKVKIRIFAEPTAEVWEGAQREREKRVRVRQQPPEHARREVVGEHGEVDLFELWAQDLADEEQGRESDDGNDSSSSSQATSSTSTESSRTSSHAQGSSTSSENEPQGHGAVVQVPQPLRALHIAGRGEAEPERVRVRRVGTFEWVLSDSHISRLDPTRRSAAITHAERLRIAPKLEVGLVMTTTLSVCCVS